MKELLSEQFRGQVTGPEELLIDWLSEQPEYEDITIKGEAGICCLFRFFYTWAILSGLNQFGYEDRWCYATREKAKAAYDAWDGSGEPQGWHRHPDTGRRRENGDPATEYVAP
jgi:hypothetical protein